MFYERLKAMCDAKGTTITAVIRAIDGSTGSVNGWKNGRAPVSDIVVRMAKYLGTSTDYLLGVTDDPNPAQVGMRKLDNNESQLIDKLRASDAYTRGIVYNMATAALAASKGSNEIVTPAPVPIFSFPKGGKSHREKAGRKSSVLKNVDGDAAAGLPITAVPETDRTVRVPDKYIGPDYFVVRARGDSMIDANIDDGDLCVFQRDAYRDAGRIMLAQIDGLTDQPDVTIKQVFIKGNKVELRPANKAYSSMFFPINEVNLVGVLVDILTPECEER